MFDTVRQYFTANRPAGVVAAFVFGSHARDSSHAESDLDIGLVLDRISVPDRPAREGLALHVATELIAATHRNRVDAVVLNDASPELAVSVIGVNRLVYCADPELLHAFVRTALLRNADLQPFLQRTRRLKLQAMTR